MIPAATVANKPGTPRRLRIRRKTIVQGRPDVRLSPVVLPGAFCCTRTAGAVSTRPSLRPLLEEGRSNKQGSDAKAGARERAHVGSEEAAIWQHLRCHCPRRRAIQYAAASRF